MLTNACSPTTPAIRSSLYVRRLMLAFEGKDKMIQDLSNIIRKFFIVNKNALIENSSNGELDLIEALRFMEELNLSKDTSSGEAMFGWGRVRSDFRPNDKDKKDIIIEVKYIRTTQTKSRKNYKECDVKNSLSQIIEQAVCKKVGNAVLVVIDSGRACSREWNEREVLFIKMFKKNHFIIF